MTNWSSTLGQPEGIISQYANLTALHTLPTSAVSVTAGDHTPDGTGRRGPGHYGHDHEHLDVDCRASSCAPTCGAATAAGQELSGDNELQSSIWQGNDITLWPGESQTLVVTYSSADLNGATPVISVSGWNVPKIDIAAPVP